MQTSFLFERPTDQYRGPQNVIIVIVIKIIALITALAQIPISTFSHIWVFVRQYGVMFVIIVIIIIIKSEGVNAAL